MREAEAMAVFFACVTGVTIVGMMLSTMRRMYQIQRETALKMKCVECGMHPRDIERVVGIKPNSADLSGHQAYESSFVTQKPVPPVVAAR
jgi:hypothetical protein